MSDIVVTTMNDLPGFEVTEVFGEVFGLTVRSRNIGSDIGGGCGRSISPAGPSCSQGP